MSWTIDTGSMETDDGRPDGFCAEEIHGRNGSSSASRDARNQHALAGTPCVALEAASGRGGSPLAGEEFRWTSAKHQRIKLRNAPWPREARRYPISESPAEAGALALSFDPARMRIVQSRKNTEDWRGLRRQAVSHLRRAREGVSGPFSARDKAFPQKPAAMDKSSVVIGARGDLSVRLNVTRRSRTADELVASLGASACLRQADATRS